MPGTRPPIEQTFFSFAVAVGTAATPIAAQIDLSSMIDSFIICNFSTNLNSVFLGDGNITTASGLEILTSTAMQFVIQQERQFYESQEPLIAAVELAGLLSGCTVNATPIQIPVKVWKLSNVFLIAAAATTVGAIAFRNVYT